jgi:hypothetical protein
MLHANCYWGCDPCEDESCEHCFTPCLTCLSYNECQYECEEEA